MSNPIIELPDLYVGYFYPRTDIQKGMVYYKGDHLANFWINNWPPQNNKIIFNRDKLCFDLGIPVSPSFDSVEKMLEWVANQIALIEEKK